ncbi:P-loop containing nucleoside triphosphate hydrolase protein [Multifurca ochricompacta]|uniref:RNA helicase n=1 Tax=Multifurca ochricompacta TaxID=376703 RepID=A0AAD4QLZ9_9AGAM|nr:P-loop containing nucleoside triphosphate hydrolase protein [Multifurca ochricompacta]
MAIDTIRPTSDDRKSKHRPTGVNGKVDDTVDERQERKKKRRERKSEKEGVINGMKKTRKNKVRKNTEGTFLDPLVDGLATTAETKKEIRKKERKSQKVVDSDPIPTTESQESHKRKKEKRRHDQISDAVPAPIPLKRPRTASPTEAEAYLKAHNISVHLPPNFPTLAPIISFDTLPVPDLLHGAFSTFKNPTPVQACAWPPALSGKDVIGIAETGSGKTLAFGIPALARILSSDNAEKGPRVLVLAPTRELALQTYESLSALKAVHCAAVFGGVDKAQQARAIKGVQLVVGTPGRVLDLIRDGVLVLAGVEYLVLDEADRMLDKGFENDIRTIIGYTKQGVGRQTLMFSATWPEAVRRLANSFLHDPVRITVGSDDLTANSRVAQEIEVFDDDREKDQRLLAHLRKLVPKKKGGGPPARILVFVLYKKEATRVENTLRRAGYTVGALHGDMTQPARLDALQQFRDGITRLLVATDVAARGLDIPDVGCVLNYSFPLTVEDYIHRIGRTGGCSFLVSQCGRARVLSVVYANEIANGVIGRGGKSGRSITFFTGSNHERGLAGELARVLRDSGVDVTPLSSKFSMSIKKKTHGVYGVFFREDVDMTAVPKKIVFED